MKPIELVERALRELGEQATHDEIHTFIGKTFGIAVAAKFIPIFRATIKGHEALREAREKAAAIGEQEKKNAEARMGKSRKTSGIGSARPAPRNEH